MTLQTTGSTPKIEKAKLGRPEEKRVRKPARRVYSNMKRAIYGEHWLIPSWNNKLTNSSNVWAMR